MKTYAIYYKGRSVLIDASRWEIALKRGAEHFNITKRIDKHGQALSLTIQKYI